MVRRRIRGGVTTAVARPETLTLLRRELVTAITQPVTQAWTFGLGLTTTFRETSSRYRQFRWLGPVMVEYQPMCGVHTSGGVALAIETTMSQPPRNFRDVADGRPAVSGSAHKYLRLVWDPRTLAKQSGLVDVGSSEFRVLLSTYGDAVGELHVSYHTRFENPHPSMAAIVDAIVTQPLAASNSIGKPLFDKPHAIFPDLDVTGPMISVGPEGTMLVVDIVPGNFNITIDTDGDTSRNPSIWTSPGTPVPITAAIFQWVTNRVLSLLVHEAGRYVLWWFTTRAHVSVLAVTRNGAMSRSTTRYDELLSVPRPPFSWDEFPARLHRSGGPTSSVGSVLHRPGSDSGSGSATARSTRVPPIRIASDQFGALGPPSPRRVGAPPEAG